MLTEILAACVITAGPVLPRSLGPTAWSRCQREDIVCLDLSVDQERQISLKMLHSATRKWRHRARNERGQLAQWRSEVVAASVYIDFYGGCQKHLIFYGGLRLAIKINYLYPSWTKVKIFEWKS